MVLSFHPNIIAHENILCAGRLPDEQDEQAVKRADAVLLPQGCSEVLYRMCRTHCAQVFPNYDCRFDFPGKLGQAALFRQTATAMPATRTFRSVETFRSEAGGEDPFGFPLIFKSNWGGEGETVFLLKSDAALRRCLAWAAEQERAGYAGFLIQEFVPGGGRDLRVVVIGRQMYSYWRCVDGKESFLTNIRAGGFIDHTFAPELQEKGKSAVRAFCKKTKINLAGFDLLFSEKEDDPEPLFLEINYFFGRRGLGGSFRYYELLEKAVRIWLNERGLMI